MFFIVQRLAPKKFQRKFTANDYPQRSRWKVTHKPSIRHIFELCNVSITTVGSYFPPGRKPRPGEEKLGLLVEGSAQREVCFALV